MTKFSEFIKDEQVNKRSNHNDKTEQDISKLIDKYSTYSQDDLMNEFLKETEKKKENGELDDDKLEKVKNVLTPYLSPEQTEKLNQLLNMVKQ